jgi:hypothetical protein
MSLVESIPRLPVLRSTIAAVLLLFAVVCPAAAEEEPPLVTDRPDVTESAETVARGRVQIEAGYNFVNFDLGDETLELSVFPSTLVRVGLDRRVELRFEWLGYISESRTEDGIRTDDSGPGNTALGAKIKLREERGAAPQLALLVDAALPTGNKALRTERIDPAIRLAGSNTFSDRLSLGYNLGVVALSIEDDIGEANSYAIGRYSAALGIGINERWGSFVEFFGFIPFSGPESPRNSFDTGFTYLSSKTVQLDVSGGIGLNRHADDWFVGAGFSIRLPR